MREVRWSETLVTWAANVAVLVAMVLSAGEHWHAAYWVLLVSYCLILFNYIRTFPR